ncbi:hypothetical protein HHX47_DHR6000320, partial [Lentinula edodes]
PPQLNGEARKGPLTTRANFYKSFNLTTSSYIGSARVCATKSQ